MNALVAIQAVLVLLFASGITPTEASTAQPAALPVSYLVGPAAQLALPAQSSLNSERSQEHAGGWTIGWPGPGCYSALPDPCCAGDLQVLSSLGMNGLHFTSFKVNPGTRGLPFLAVYSGQVSSIEPAFLVFLNEQGRFAGSKWASLEPLGATGSARGTVPEDAHMAYMFSCNTGKMDARYHAAPFDEIQETRFGGKFGAAVRDFCPGWGHVGFIQLGNFRWTAPEILRDGTPAQTTRVEVHFASPTTIDAEMRIYDAQGALVVQGTDSLMWSAPQITGEYTILVLGCWVVAGPYSVQVYADVSAAKSKG